MLDLVKQIKFYENQTTEELKTAYDNLRNDILKLYHDLRIAVSLGQDFGEINEKISDKSTETSAIEFILNQRGF